ncbi:MAG: NfeD family protein [Victivallales bacterium]|nr:NfeD family protein [Victivallales bacterium]
MKNSNRILRRLAVFAVIVAGVLLMTGASGRKSDEELFSKFAADVVYYVPQFTDFSEISTQEMYFLKKTLLDAEKNNVKAVIFEIDTPGGRVDIAYKYASVIAKSGVPVIAYVNPHGISAGMIIAVSADRIAIDPAGIIGDAMPLAMGPGGVKPIIDREKKHERENLSESESNKAKKSDKDKVDKSPAAERIEKLSKELEEVKEKIRKKETDSQKIERLEKELQKLKKDQVEKGKSKERKKKFYSTEEDLRNQKFLTVFFKKLQTDAEKNGRPVRVIRAMADPYQKLTLKEDGIEHDKISPLTLSAKEAKKLKVVDYICNSRAELMQKLGLGNCRVEEIRKSEVDQLISFLTYPAIAGVLIALGLVGIYVEIKTPGFGVPGILGITALTLFFLGHIGSGASEWGPIVIFFVGLVLLMLEIFVIPGFGIVGLLGISCIVISFIAAFGFDNFAVASQTVAYSMLGALIAMILLTVYVLPKSPLFKWVRLDMTQKRDAGYMSHKEVAGDLVHQRGEAYTKLRPVGTALINGKRYEVTTDGDYVDQGEKIEVIEATPMKITVKKV